MKTKIHLADSHGVAHGVVLTAGGHRRVLDPGDFYKTKTQCQSAVNSCYIPLKNLYTYKMMIATEGVTDRYIGNAACRREPASAIAASRTANTAVI